MLQGEHNIWSVGGPDMLDWDAMVLMDAIVLTISESKHPKNPDPDYKRVFDPDSL